MRGRLFLLLLGVAALAGPAPARAQGPTVTAWADTADTAPGQPRTLDPTHAFLMSVLVPGAAQWFQGEGWWVAYTAVEAWAWAIAMDRRREGRMLERRYRELAWTVARDRVGPPRDGDFEYYEALTKYTASGAFDADPDRPGVQPERDEQTYNGAVWALARAIYLPADGDQPAPGDEAYRAAIRYYTENAVPEDLAWSWVGRSAEQETYARLIERSDEALRAATRTLGLILANHLLSAVDAFIVARLRAGGEQEISVELKNRIHPMGGSIGWTAQVQVAWPRR